MALNSHPILWKDLMSYQESSHQDELRSGRDLFQLVMGQGLATSGNITVINDDNEAAHSSDLQGHLPEAFLILT